MEAVNVYWNISCKEIRLQFYSRGINLNHAHNKLAGVSSGMPGSAPFWNPKQEKICSCTLIATIIIIPR